MEPAQSIIRRLGGPSKVAEATGVHRTRVSNWARPTDKGGTGGRIPQKHWGALITLAAQTGVALSADELFATGIAA